MITAIVLPADLRTPIRTVELDKRDLNAYRGLVGGSLEIITFERPEATLYLNDEGKLEGLPLNQRATLMASVHNSAFRGRDVITGDALLVGPADRHGDDLSAPKNWSPCCSAPSAFGCSCRAKATRSSTEICWSTTTG